MSTRPDPLSRVCLAISSFKNDAEVLALLERARPTLRRFATVLVVDSLGSGSFAQALAQGGFTPWVTYHCFPENLGSAGNLATRLELAGQSHADFVYAVNHDGDLDADAIARLVALADGATGPLGAIYPLRRMSERGNAFDITGRYRFPFTAIRSYRAPVHALSPVYWSSSNGALYALAPVRRGLLPYADLWMGFEDLGYGWLLERSGYRQYVARDVSVADGYEYRKSPVGYVTRKPSWYAYYYARNLLVTTRRTEQPLVVQGLALSRVLLELGVTLALRSNKRARLSATAQGIRDALLNRTGKWRLP